MIVARQPDALPNEPRAATIGVFDCVHLGHRRILEAVRATGLRSLVVTFEPHPRTVRGNHVELLTTTERRLEGYFRREWSYAIDRARNIAEGALFILPVCIDDTDGGNAQVPEKFKAVHFTRLPGGEVPPEFAERIRDLLSSRQ